MSLRALSIALLVMMGVAQAGLASSFDQAWQVSDRRFSVGVVTFTTPPGSVEEMVKRADELMYEVKRSGKSAIVSQVV